jgi:hypothetical protein
VLLLQQSTDAPEPENDESHKLTEIAVVGVGKQIKDMSASQMQKHVSHSPLSSLHGLLTTQKKVLHDHERQQRRKKGQDRPQRKRIGSIWIMTRQIN